MHVHHHLRRGASPEAITVLGETTFRKAHHRFGLLPTDRLRHVWVLGKTGSGKSTLLANMLAQDLRQGSGFTLLDPHGDLVDEALSAVPAHRKNEIVLFEPGDAAYAFSFNVFRQAGTAYHERSLLTSQLLSVFKKQFGYSWGPRLEHILRNAILAVAEDPRATLVFLYRFLTDPKLRGRVVDNVSDGLVRYFWRNEFENYGKRLQADATAPVLNKLGAFVSHPLVRRIVGQVRSRLDVAEMMNDRRVLLARLSAGGIGDDASEFLGGLLLSSIQLAAMKRARGRAPHIVYADEFQRFANDSLVTLLSESRKFGLGAVLAHQYLAQLPEALRDAVIGNVGTMVLFRIGAADAEFLEGEVHPVFTAGDLKELERFNIVVRMTARGETLAPFSARTIAPEIRCLHTDPDAIRELSRERYCQPSDKVDYEIDRDL